MSHMGNNVIRTRVGAGCTPSLLPHWHSLIPSREPHSAAGQEPPRAAVGGLCVRPALSPLPGRTGPVQLPLGLAPAPLAEKHRTDCSDVLQRK